MHIPVIDIFAGPGGLGEGFSSFRVGKSDNKGFRIAASAEKDPFAHQTLRLRAFVRQFGAEPPESYYEYLRDPARRVPYDLGTVAEWRAASEEALCVTLGDPAQTGRFHDVVRAKIAHKDSSVLIGGPPCQAYSLAGRSRNKGIKTYRPEKDHRHFLYREYLAILNKFRPAIFIMENVKGLLSAKVEGSSIFAQILVDLADPGKAMGNKSSARYELLPLVVPEPATKPDDHSRFIVRSEEYGIPQARHRVILLGVRRDVGVRGFSPLRAAEASCVSEAWVGLPKLRSGLSGPVDSGRAWKEAVETQRRRILKALKKKDARTGEVLTGLAFRSDLERGGVSVPSVSTRRVSSDLARFIGDPRLDLVLNHESRSHMESDLGRYLFCSAFSAANEGRSPTSDDFPENLAPNHANWKSGAFADRFRVHAPRSQATTITSHIAKDGHYYIHYSPEQCRSMTVREAARIQTFPDNYFFAGNRSQQYTQVGNAVPPLLAKQIAGVVWGVLNR